MPITHTYPGVYLEEIPGGPQAITGVTTSITVFVGSARKGPVAVSLSVFNFGDYDRSFGGLWETSTMCFPVYDFFNNGGQQAVIVRVHNGAQPASFHVPTDNPSQVLHLEAANPGSFGNNVRVVIHRNNADQSLFTLIAEEIDPTTQHVVLGETFTNVCFTPGHSRFLSTVLEQESTLVRVDGQLTLPNVSPKDGTTLPTPNSGSDGDVLTEAQILEGLTALDQCDLFNLLCIPPYRADGNVDKTVLDSAANYCEMRRAFLIIDSPSTWTDVAKVEAGFASDIGTRSKNAALYFPRIRKPNPLKNSQVETFAACGAIAGIFANTDLTRGVWKAPGGIDAVINGVADLSVVLNDSQVGELNALGINCLRSFPELGTVIWGAQTLQGTDNSASEWNYIQIRRSFIFIEESIDSGTQWAVFEPNDEPLWAQIRLIVGAFLDQLFRQGAFQGVTPSEAYFVKCDSDTTTQNDIDQGIVNIIVGFAPLKPAEFVVINLQQIAGQSQS